MADDDEDVVDSGEETDAPEEEPGEEDDGAAGEGEDEGEGEDLPDLPQDPEEAREAFQAALREREQLTERLRNSEHARQEAWQDFRKQRDRTNRVMGLLERVLGNEVAAQDAPQEPSLPDPKDDLVGHLVGKMEQAIDARLKPLQEGQDNQQYRAEQAATDNYIEQAQASFAQENPGYPIDDAVEHLMATNKKIAIAEMTLQYPDADRDEIEQIAQDRIERLRDTIVYRMRKAGRNVFGEIRKAAEARGFRATPQNGKPNRLEQTRESVRAGSPQVGRRVVPPPDPSRLASTKRVANMSDDDFGRYLGEAAKKLGVSEDQVFRRMVRTRAHT